MIGESMAPRSPPFCRMRFFFFTDVFLSASVLMLFFSRRRRLNCPGVSGTLPFIMFLAHSLTHATNSLSQFLTNCRLAVFQLVYLLKQRQVPSRSFAHLEMMIKVGSDIFYISVRYHQPFLRILSAPLVSPTLSADERTSSYCDGHTPPTRSSSCLAWN